MKISENWLRTLVNPDLSRDELAHLLTMAGIEVESIEPVAPKFDKVVVAKVLEVEKHPDADRLNVCRVDAGLPDPLQIVCGAPNVYAGAVVPCALEGAVLPGITIRKAKVRGIESFGMLCSGKELGIESDVDGLLMLAQDAPVGLSIREYLDLDDNIFELKLTPNRADCLGALGVAREISAMTGAALNFPQAPEVAAQCDDSLSVTVVAKSACPLYLGRVIRGVDASKPSPEWMARRLERSGIRPKNVLVDITNFVLLEYGQPLHAFDLAKLSGGIRVRFASESEKIGLLNGEERELGTKNLVIADDKGPVALAGIMGGSESAVSLETSDIFLEAAFFDPVTMAKGRMVNLSSDSSYRFERGVDFGKTREALARATALILECAGGSAGPVTDVEAQLPSRDPVKLRISRIRKILGVEFTKEKVLAILRNLFSATDIAESEDDDVLWITPPTYRFDLKIEEDLVEEVARLYGYDNIPGVTPQASMAMLPAKESERALSAIRKLIAARGYTEAIGYAFVDAQWEEDFCGNPAPILLKNPIASQMGAMRSSLVGGLIDALAFNLNRKQSRIRLFEIGACFSRAGEGYAQKEMLAGLCYGSAHPEQWGMDTRWVDFYDVKSDLEALFFPMTPDFEVCSHPALHPGRSAAMNLEGKRVGVIGEIHPKWVQKYDLPKAPVFFEVELDALKVREIPAFSEISKFPPVRRDIAVLVDEKISAMDMLNACRSVLNNAKVELFDLYKGQGVEAGKKSLAFRVTIQDTQKTLLDAEVDAMISQLIEALEKRFDSKLRV
jgi:phenylalanyl-tRNA synthetase beta chain